VLLKPYCADSNAPHNYLLDRLGIPRYTQGYSGSPSKTTSLSIHNCSNATTISTSLRPFSFCTTCQNDGWLMIVVYKSIERRQRTHPEHCEGATISQATAPGLPHTWKP